MLTLLTGMEIRTEFNPGTLDREAQRRGGQFGELRKFCEFATRASRPRSFCLNRADSASLWNAMAPTANICLGRRRKCWTRRGAERRTARPGLRRTPIPNHADEAARPGILGQMKERIVVFLMQGTRPLRILIFGGIFLAWLVMILLARLFNIDTDIGGDVEFVNVVLIVASLFIGFGIAFWIFRFLENARYEREPPDRAGCALVIGLRETSRLCVATESGAGSRGRPFQRVDRQIHLCPIVDDDQSAIESGEIGVERTLEELPAKCPVVHRCNRFAVPLQKSVQVGQAEAPPGVVELKGRRVCDLAQQHGIPVRDPNKQIAN